MHCPEGEHRIVNVLITDDCNSDEQAKLDQDDHPAPNVNSVLGVDGSYLLLEAVSIDRLKLILENADDVREGEEQDEHQDNLAYAPHVVDSILVVFADSLSDAESQANEAKHAYLSESLLWRQLVTNHLH